MGSTPQPTRKENDYLFAPAPQQPVQKESDYIFAPAPQQRSNDYVFAQSVSEVAPFM